MSASTTYFKVGFLAIVGLSAATVAAFGLGMRVTRQDTVDYHSYFDESVEGLEVGAPVKYRGMPIGSVHGFQIAPDNRRVDVTLDLAASDVRRLGLQNVSPELRAQLGTQGITGVKFIDIDFFDPRTSPASALSFRPAEHYIPTTPSLLKGLGDSLQPVLQRLPVLVDTAVATLQRVEPILGDFYGERLPGRIGQTLDDADGAARDLRALLHGVDRARIPDKAANAIETFTAAVAKVEEMMNRVNGDAGLVASAKRATDSIGDLGRITSGSATDLGQTLRDLDEAAQAVRDLAEGVERDPDMLVKGRARERVR